MRSIAKKCKFSDKPCRDNYISHGTRKQGTYCRLAEWKRKTGVCPYDNTIRSSGMKLRVRRQKGQTKLEV